MCCSSLDYCRQSLQYNAYSLLFYSVSSILLSGSWFYFAVFYMHCVSSSNNINFFFTSYLDRFFFLACLVNLLANCCISFVLNTICGYSLYLHCVPFCHSLWFYYWLADYLLFLGFSILLFPLLWVRVWPFSSLFFLILYRASHFLGNHFTLTWLMSGAKLL